MSEPQQPSQQGFSGLVHLSSDISKINEEVSQIVKNAAAQEKNLAEQESTEKNKAILKRILWGVGIAIFLFLFFKSIKIGEKPAPRPSYNEPATTSSHYNYNRTSTYSDRSYERPYAGNKVHNVPEIRWCLRQKLKVETIRDYLKFNGPRTHSKIDYFNSLVYDFNDRCGSFRYRRGDLEAAQSDINNHRYEIESSARDEIMRM